MTTKTNCYRGSFIPFFSSLISLGQGALTNITEPIPLVLAAPWFLAALQTIEGNGAKTDPVHIPRHQVFINRRPFKSEHHNPKNHRRVASFPVLVFRPFPFPKPFLATSGKLPRTSLHALVTMANIHSPRSPFSFPKKIVCGYGTRWVSWTIGGFIRLSSHELLKVPLCWHPRGADRISFSACLADRVDVSPVAQTDRPFSRDLP